MQRQHRITGTLAACAGCGRQPHHYEVLGPGLHFLECSPCAVRTPKFRTLQQAVEAWEAQETVITQPRQAA